MKFCSAVFVNFEYYYLALGREDTQFDPNSRASVCFCLLTDRDSLK